MFEEVKVVELAQQEPPSHCFKRQVFATFIEDPVGLRERRHIGMDNIIWARDYPHSETTWPDSRAPTDEYFAPYGDEDKAKVLWQN
jgi:Amidohydrolase